MRPTDDSVFSGRRADRATSSAGFAYAEGVEAFQKAGDQPLPVGPAGRLSRWGHAWSARRVRANALMLDDYEIAHISGGPSRVVLTAIAALEDRDAIRLRNRLAGRALGRVRRLPHDQRLDHAIELGAQASLVAATEVVAGEGPVGSHPVEREVYEALLRGGGLHPERLKVLPAVSGVGEACDARFGIRRHRRWRGMAAVGGLLAALLTATMLTWALVAVVSDEPDRVLRIGALGGLAIGGVIWALWDDPVPRVVARQIKWERSQRGITAAALRDRIDGWGKTRPSSFSTMVALSGGAALWAYAPELGIAATGLSQLDPAVLPQSAGAGCGGVFGGGCGGGCGGGGCGGCGGCG